MNKKANVFYMGYDNTVHYTQSKMYESNDCILKEDFINEGVFAIPTSKCKKNFNFKFNQNEYFKINTNIIPEAYIDFLYCFNNRNINVSPDEIEKSNSIIIATSNDFSNICACFQTLADFGVYRTVMKYNYFTIVQELNCDLWSSLDIRKPFKLVKRNKLIDINTSIKNVEVDINKKIIGEIKPEYAHWYVYHPLQIKTTLNNITKEKSKIWKIKNNNERKQAIHNFRQELKALKNCFFEDKRDEEWFLESYTSFWD